MGNSKLRPSELLTNVHVKNVTLNFEGFVLDQAYYHLTLKRKWIYYVLNIMAPVAVTSALNILCFTLPSDSGERITLCISIYLTLAVFLNVVNNALPETSDEQSILSIYIGLQFLASAFTIIVTMVTLKLYHKRREINCSTPCGNILNMRKNGSKYQPEGTDADNYIMKNEPIATAGQTLWNRLSETLNTVCFYLSVAWNIGLIIVVLVVARSQ